MVKIDTFLSFQTSGQKHSVFYMSCGFFTDTPQQIEEVPFYAQIAECLYHERLQDFVKCSSCIYWDVHRALILYVVCFNNWFHICNLTFLGWIPLAMTYNFLYMFICSIWREFMSVFVKDIGLYFILWWVWYWLW